MTTAALAIPAPRRTPSRTASGEAARVAKRQAAERERRKRASWIQTYTGRKFRPFAPVIDDIDIEDIAHALSLQCRWNGHVRALKYFYSVAQHAVLCSYYVQDTTAAHWALHHDDAEAYISDVPSPVKAFCPELKDAELVLEEAIRERFSIPFDDDIARRVKAVDTWMMFQEGRALLRHPELLDDWAREPGRVIPCLDHLPKSLPKGDITPWPAEVAKSRFMSRFHHLAKLNRRGK